MVFIPLEQNTNLNHIKGCENKDFCNVVMPSEDTKILEFSQRRKSNKTIFIIYADFESLKKKRPMDIKIILKDLPWQK